MTVFILIVAGMILLSFLFKKEKPKPHNPSKSDDPFIRESFDRAITEHWQEELDEEESEEEAFVRKEVELVKKYPGQPYFIVIDVETSGLRKYRNKDPRNLSNWPRIVQIAYQVFDINDQEIHKESVIFKQPRPLPSDSIEIHGITDQMCKELGVKPEPVLHTLYEYSQEVCFMVAHNAIFDHDVIEANMRRFKIADDFALPWVCTMEYGRKVPGFRPLDVNGRKKNGKLLELHEHLFGEKPEQLHDAKFDTEAAARCFFEMKSRGIIPLDYSFDS